jgi:hypothetical protein
MSEKCGGFDHVEILGGTVGLGMRSCTGVRVGVVPSGATRSGLLSWMIIFEGDGSVGKEVGVAHWRRR